MIMGGKEKMPYGGQERKMKSELLSKTELDKLPLTMSYVPFQGYDDWYDDDEALRRGTLYSSIDKPFTAVEEK